MKKLLIALFCVLAACPVVFASPGNEKNEGKLICGVTIFDPMNYKDESGKWTGFETEFAQAVGAKLGIQVEFQEIEWSRKFLELQAGTIGCIWNGMTANAVDSATGRPRYESVDFTYSYMLNQQAVVVRASRLNEFRGEADLAGKTAAAETGSAGEEAARDVIGSNGKFIGSNVQRNTFIEVKSGAVDFAVVDILLAKQMAGVGDYSDLAIAPIEMDAEVYAVGFPKGSPLVSRVNQAMEELFASGEIMRIAQKYNLENTVLLDKTRIQDM